MRKHAALVALGSMVLAGCLTSADPRHAISADPVRTPAAFKGQPVAVGNFSAAKPSQTEIACRGVHPITTPGREPFELFIRKALIDELTIAGAYAPNAPVVLTGRLDDIDFSSGLTDAAWKLALSIRSSNGKALSVSENYPFTSNYFGEIACNQKTAGALRPAVQNLVGKLVRDPAFADLLTPVSPSEDDQRFFEAAATGDLVALHRMLDVAAVSLRDSTGYAGQMRRIVIEPRDSRGWTPLMHAVFREQESAASALIVAGANVNARASDGTTPTMLVAFRGNEYLARLLLTQGADPRFTNRSGLTAATISRLRGHTRLADTLDQAAGAAATFVRAAKLDEANDYTSALPLFRSAALNGSAEAMRALAFAYALGRGVTKDDTEGARWFRRAADSGDAVSMRFLGQAYKGGRGVPKSDVEGFRWSLRAAEAGDGPSMLRVALMYDEGDGVAQDSVQATNWVRRSGETGEVFAMDIIGDDYYFGRGVAKDYIEAVRWYRKGADGGNARAMSALGRCYSNGLGVEQDETQAVRWYRRGADAGDEQAQQILERAGQR